MTEVWVGIEGFPHYQVSTLGRVRSCVTRTNTWFGKILRPYKDKDGYLRVTLFRAGEKFPRYVHLLVAKVFVLNPVPNILVEVNHKNGNRADAAAFNLEWRTNLGNKRHAVKTGQNGAKGVTFNKTRGTWHAYYSLAGKHIHLGSFKTEQAALAARKSAIEELPNVA